MLQLFEVSHGQISVLHFIICTEKWDPFTKKNLIENPIIQIRMKYSITVQWSPALVGQIWLGSRELWFRLHNGHLVIWKKIHKKIKILKQSNNKLFFWDAVKKESNLWDNKSISKKFANSFFFFISKQLFLEALTLCSSFKKFCAMQFANSILAKQNPSTKSKWVQGVF